LKVVVSDLIKRRAEAVAAAKPKASTTNLVGKAKVAPLPKLGASQP
jgi:hypothetical protein